MALIKEYFDLTQQYLIEYGEKTIVLMQVGAFFEVYGVCDEKKQVTNFTKILDFSQICELTVVPKKPCYYCEKEVVMAGFKEMYLDKYVKKLLDAGFTTAVYVQDEQAKNTTRSLFNIFSPGTYFQNDNLVLTNNTTCVWVKYIDNKIFLKGKHVVIGIANIDIYTGKTTLFQFKEIYINNPTTYDELERFISIHNPSEIILISDIPSEKEFNNIIDYAGINCNSIQKYHFSDTNTNAKQMTMLKNCEKQIYQKEILSRFYKFNDYSVFSQNFYENDIATQAFCYLLDFVYKHNPQLVHKIAEPVFENVSTRLVLANHTLKQLNIIDDGTVKSSNKSCVSKMLNKCITPMGKRKFLHNLLHPTYDETYLQNEYDITEHFLEKYLNDKEIDLKTLLLNIRDLSKWERQIFMRKLSPKSFCVLYANMHVVKQIFNKIMLDEKMVAYLKIFINNVIEISSYCDNISNFIAKYLNIDLAKDVDQTQDFDINFINPGIFSDLDERNEIYEVAQLKLHSIRNYFNSLVEEKDAKGKLKNNDFVKLHETEKHNFNLLCTSRRCNLLKDVLPKDETIVKLPLKEEQLFEFTVSKTQFVFGKQSYSDKNANCYIEDNQINAICNNITSIKNSMKDLITCEFNKFLISFENLLPELDTIIHFVTLIDVVYTKAVIAKSFHYCKPVIQKGDKAFVKTQGLRHCLIEQFELNEMYITNDIVLGDRSTDGILLYGTNAVGKTCLIKSLGIAVLMAQAGLYVPSTEFIFKPYQHIFTRIIGNDNLFKGLSTFAVEMSELRTILRLVNENSLVLGDELCSGTETMSAISIFVAGIQQLASCKSSFIFATHLHEIIKYDEITSLNTVKLKHMSVIYDREKDTLVYDRKLRDGAGNNMYGLEVCKSLNLPEHFIQNAYEIRQKYNPENKSLLSLKTSHYNSKKLMGLCERCGENIGVEVHHLLHQANADENGFIVKDDVTMHKNNLANLMIVCNKCHDDMHTLFKKGSKRVKGEKCVKLNN
jgi:DNA mismatch repair protein MutS